MPYEDFVATTPEIQSEFETELAATLQRIRSSYGTLPLKERVKPEMSLQALETQAKQALVQKYERISGTAELKLSIEAGEYAGEYAGLPPAIATDYLYWREREVSLLREQTSLDDIILSTQKALSEMRTLSFWMYSIPSITERHVKTVMSGKPIGEDSIHYGLEYNNIIAQYNAAIERSKVVATEMVHTKAYQSLYEGLGAYIQSGAITCYDDLLSLTDDEGNPMTLFKDMDDATLRDTFNKISSLVLKAPDDTSFKELNYDEVIAQLIVEPKSSFKGIHTLTMESIVKYLKAPSMPELPEGMSAEDVSKVFSDAGVPDDLVADLESLDEYTKQLGDYWKVLSSNQSAVLQGLENAVLPEIGIGDYIKQTMIQPGLTALDVFSPYYTEWIAPWGAMLYKTKYKAKQFVGIGLSEHEKDYQVLYAEAKTTDDWWHAGSKAFEAAEIGFFDRFLFEWILEPTTWLGVGILPKLAARIPVIGIRLAKSMGLFERAWIASWDILIFDRIKNAGKLVAKTPFQAAITYAGNDMKVVAKYLVARANGRYYSRIPLRKAVPWLKEARDWALLHPEDEGVMGLAGKTLLKRSPLDETSILDLMKKFKSEAPVTRDMVLGINSVTNSQIAGRTKQLLTRKTTPPLFLRTLGVAETKGSLKLARKEIDKMFLEGIRNSNILLDEAKNVPDMLAKLFNRNHAIYLDTVKAAAAHNLEMSGRMSSLYSRVAITAGDAWRVTFDRWVVTPGARMYLAFCAYGPGNILEGYIKQVAARQVPYNPLRLLYKSKPVSVVNPTVRGQRLTAGLYKPLELDIAIPRLEMAGETPSYLKLADMSPRGREALQKWRSILSGGPIGRFFIDMPGSIGLHQRWDYYSKMFIKYLGEDEAGRTMTALAKNIDDAVRKLPDNFLDNLGMTRSELKCELLDRSIAGPAATRNMLDDMIADRLLIAEDKVKREAYREGKKIGKKAVSADTALADRMSGGRVAEAAGAYPLVPQSFTDDLIVSASDGSLYAGRGAAIHAKFEGFRAATYDYIIHAPEFYSAKFTEYANVLLKSEVKNRDDFLALLKEIEDMQTFLRGSTNDTIKATFELKTKMRTQMKFYNWNEWFGKYSVGPGGVYDGLIAYNISAFDKFEFLVKRMKASMPKYLSPTERVEVNKLFSSWVNEQRYLKDFWVKRRTAEKEGIERILALSGDARKEPWAIWHAEQNAAHAKREVDQAPFHLSVNQQQYRTSEVLDILSAPPPTIDASGRALTKVDVSKLFHSRPDQMGQSMLRLETMTLKPKYEFVTEVRAQAEIMATKINKTPSALGFSDESIANIYDDVLRDMCMSPEAASVIEPHLMQLKALEDEIFSIYNTKGLVKGTADDFQKWLDELADVLDDVPGYATPEGRLSPEFSASKQKAADNASKEYYKDWADYTNQNASTDAMRSIYPFWTYELHRLFWLPRASLRQPGIFKGWGTYMDNTEDGYMHIPGTSLEANPLRGTVFMGGMIRLIRKDYPEYYDRYPHVSGIFDFYSRMGFYPATYINFLKMFGGKTVQGKANFGEVLPAWVKAPLNAFIAAFPDSEPAKLLLDTVLPEPFRDYVTVLEANAICQREQKTFNGMDILDKRTESLKLTPEEEDIWTRAVRGIGWMGAIMEEAGMLRIRTEEQVAAWEASGKMIEELTGYTLKQQLWMRQHGFRVGDYAQLDPLQQNLLSEMDAMKYHSGIFTTLMPTAWQEEDRRRREFFGEVRSYSENAKVKQEALDDQARLGEINMKQWARGRSELRGKNANAFTILSETERYQGVAITMEDTIREDGTIREGMITRARDRNMLPPIEHPAKEILNTYYSIELEKKFDPASGKIIDDWDGYFLKIDAIINALKGAQREDLIKMITMNMTDLEKLRWDVSRVYFRGYNRRQEAILVTQFEPDQQEQIRKWIFGSPAKRDQAQEIIMPDGNKLIATYQKGIHTAGQNLRKLSPELDAWLQFFQITDTVLTDAAAQLYSQYCHEQGIPE